MRSVCFGVELWFISILVIISDPFYQSIAQPSQDQVILPDVIKRVPLPYLVCTRGTIDNLWECISKTYTGNNGILETNSTQNEVGNSQIENESTLTTPNDFPGSPNPTKSQDFINPNPTNDIPSTACPPASATTSQSVQSDQSTSNPICQPEKADNRIIFEDNFDNLDLEKWEHEVTMAGGGNWEFQMYVNNRSNSFVKDGMLYIKPTLTSDLYGEDFLSQGSISLHGGSPSDQCTNAEFNGCEKIGNSSNILNPVVSARLRAIGVSSAFKYGKVEVRAKFPSGNWLRPAISLIPSKYQYGKWPASGEIHMAEARGNKVLFYPDATGESIGINQITSSLDFGPFFPMNQVARFTINSDKGFDEDFHNYEMEWTPNYIKFSIDGNETGIVEPLDDGFWSLGKFSNDLHNPWENAENPQMAPFDQKFYIAIGLAVGGTNGFFPDDKVYENPPASRQISNEPETDYENTSNVSIKPWIDSSTTAYKEFWDGRNEWFPTWTNSAFIIDYVRVSKLDEPIQIIDI